MNRLRVHIEKIVRPISANFARKDQMREELLAHLNGLYEMELEELGDEKAALERTLDQFGDPDQTRKDLQRSVPWMERLLFCGLPCPWPLKKAPAARRMEKYLVASHNRREGESVPRHAVRMSLYVLLLFTAVFVPFLCLNLIFRFVKDDGMDWFYFSAIFAVAITLSSVLACFLFVLIGHGISRALEDWFWGRRSWLRLLGYAVLSTLAVFVSGFVFWLLAWKNLPPSLAQFRNLCIVAFGMPLFIAVAIQMGLAEFRRFGEWGNLDIEENDIP